MQIDSRRLTDFAAAIFEQGGSTAQEARHIAEHLVEANLTGHDSHGVSRIIRYVEYLQDGNVVPNQEITVVLDAPAFAVVDGNMGYGQSTGGAAVDIGIDKARQGGVAMVAFRNVAHLGRIGAWAERAAAAGILSIHFVNTTGAGMKVAPYGGTDARLSTNPIAIGLPRQNQEPMIFDAATSFVAEGKVFVANNKGDTMPPGVLIDHAGRETTDPAALYTDPPGAITTFGLHKGSGLCLMTDLLAGLLSGGGCTAPETKQLVNNMTSIYIDPERFTDNEAFQQETDRFTHWVKASPPIAGHSEILLPGEPERQRLADRRANGLPLDETTWQSIIEAARRVGIDDPTIARLSGASS
jgi:uncharacterized oxidoreductase